MKKSGLIILILLLTSCALQNINPKDIQKEGILQFYTYDITNPMDVINHSETVSKVKIKKIETFASYIDDNSQYPMTKIEVELIDDIKGQSEDNFDLLWTGGLIKSEDLSESLKTNKKYVYYEFTDILDLKKNDEYVIAYSDKIISVNGYGIFKVDDDQLVNLKTNKELKLKDIGY